MSELALAIPPELVEQIAHRAAELALQDLAGREQSPYMTVTEAAEYMRCKPQRIRDLLSQRRLTVRKDGSRTLVLRAELEAHLAGETVGPIAQLVPTHPRGRSASRVAV